MLFRLKVLDKDNKIFYDEIIMYELLQMSKRLANFVLNLEKQKSIGDEL